MRWSAVDPGGLVVLLVDLLQSGQEQDNLKRHTAPDGKNGHRHNGQVGIGQPLLWLQPQKLQKKVDVAVFRVEEPAEHQADGQGGGDIREKIECLKQSLGPKQGIDEQGCPQGEHNRDRYAHQNNKHGVAHGQPESGILKHVPERIEAESRAGVGKVHVTLVKPHPKRHEDGVDHKDRQNRKGREQIQICLGAAPGVAQRIFCAGRLGAPHPATSASSRAPVSGSKI